MLCTAAKLLARVGLGSQYLAIFTKPANAGERTTLGRFHLRNPLGVLSSFLRALRLSGWVGGPPNYKGDGEIQLPMLKIRLKSHERLNAVVETKVDILPKLVPTTGRLRGRHFGMERSQAIATDSQSCHRSPRRADASICLEKRIDKRSDRRSLCEYNQTSQQDHYDDYWCQPELLSFAHEVP